MLDTYLSALEFYIVRINEMRCWKGKGNTIDGETHPNIAQFTSYTPELLCNVTVYRELFRNYLTRYFLTLEPALSTAYPLTTDTASFEYLFKSWINHNIH
jgi:hypothetical protein